MTQLYRYIPGILLCIFVMIAGIFLADWLGILLFAIQGIDPESSKSPISGILTAIILGIVIRNTIGMNERFIIGLKFSIKYILRLGIILLGIRLSILDVFKLGAWGLPIILVCVISGLLVTLWITDKMKQPHRLGTLTAVGTGICGVTAIVGTAPGIRANDEEVAYSIANITLFGIIAMIAYPYLAHWIFAGDPIKIGLFLGTAIHETAQVAGSALIYNQVFTNPMVVDVATITKLTRNVLLVAVVPIMSYYYFKKERGLRKGEGTEGELKTPKWYQLIPYFILGFLAFSVIRTIGDATVDNTGAAFGLWDPAQWTTIWKTTKTIGSTYLLGIAMAAVGLSTSLKVFKGLGFKPFYIGLVAALTVTAVSIIMISLLAGFIKM